MTTTVRLLLLAGLIATGIFSSAPATAAVGDYTFNECIASEPGLSGITGCTDITATTDSVQSLRTIVVSPDGSNVYALGNTTNAVIRFSRSASGDLTFEECISSESVQVGCLDLSANQALVGGVSMAMSWDGRSLYIVSALQELITHIRLGEDGAMTFDGCWSSLMFAGSVCTDLSATTDSLIGAAGVAVTRDGTRVYVTSGGATGSITHFSRNQDTGNLVYSDCLSSNAIFGCNDASGTTNAAVDLGPIAVVGNGPDIYAGSDSGNAILQFQHNSGTDHLEVVDCWTGSLNPSTGCTVLPTNGLTGNTHEAIDISADGKHLYIGSTARASILRFARNVATGALTFGECLTTSGVTTGCTDSDGNFATLVSLTLSTDNATVYAGSLNDDSINQLSRDPDTGVLTWVSCLRDVAGGDCGGIDGTSGGVLDGPRAIATSPDGTSLYIGSLAALLDTDREALPPIFTDGFESGDTTAWSVTVGGN